MKKPVFAMAAALTLLAACGNDPESFAVARATQAIVTAKVAPEDAEPLTLTRASLANVVSPVQLVSIDKRNQKALVAEVAQNNGVTTWSSVDKVTVSLRDGVVVATRGLGDDLMAATGQRPNARSSADENYTRTYTLLNGLDQASYVKVVCSVRINERQVVDIVEIRYSVRELVETCKGTDVSFDNSYWIEDSGHIRKSRQWISPEVGSITIEDLRQ